MRLCIPLRHEKTRDWRMGWHSPLTGMQPVLDDFRGRCQRYMYPDLILLPLLTFLNGASLWPNPIGSQKTREPANSINMGQFPEAVWDEKEAAWVLRCKGKTERIAWFVSKKIAISLLSRNLKPFDKDHLMCNTHRKTKQKLSNQVGHLQFR